jgi:hypothetical protein
MDEMKPLQVAVIDDGEDNPNNGHVVMRTAVRFGIEIMDLSNPGPGNCWAGGGCGEQRVIPLLDGTQLTFTVIHNQDQGGEL